FDGIRGRDRFGDASKTISSADRSSLSPLKAAALSNLSWVQPRYSTSQTRRGSAHRTPFSAPDGSGLVHGGFVDLIFSSSSRNAFASSWDQPVPTRPA